MKDRADARERKRRSTNAWRKANPDKARAQYAKWRKANPDKIKRSLRRTALRRKYGITPEVVEKMQQDQAGMCAICCTDKPRGRGAWHVDHDHVSGKVRGLLCHDCNVGLGCFKDDVLRLKLAMSYLERA